MTLAEAILVLGLVTGEVEEIKKKFRELVLKHYPDKGGDPLEFNRVVQAREACEQCLQGVKRLLKQKPMATGGVISEKDIRDVVWTTVTVTWDVNWDRET